MKVRKLVSLITFVSFIVLAFTGIMLFLCPEGRVAYWSGWTMFGLSKEDYGALHVAFMTLFLVAGVWHITYNWKPIVNYLRERTKKVRVVTPEFYTALGIGVFFFAGTLAGLFPFQQLLNVEDGVKSYWEATNGSPPWGHAEETPLDRFCRRMEDFERVENQSLVTIDCIEVLAELREAGIRVESPSQQLIEIAHANSTTPQALAQVVLSVAKPRTADVDLATKNAKSGPFTLPYSGLGRMTMREYAERYDVDLDRTLVILQSQGLSIDPDRTLRDESSRFQTDPEGIIELLNESIRSAGQPDK